MVITAICVLSVSLTPKASLFQNAFVVGTGKLSVWAAGANGTAGAAVPSGPPIFQVDIPLTPGPLVVVLKDKWPPTKPENVETIAASYVPPKNGSAVRLFNLAPDVKSAGLQVSGKMLVDKVLYSLGSKWQPVPSVAQTFTAVDDAGVASHPEVTMTPPLAPRKTAMLFSRLVCCPSR